MDLRRIVPLLILLALAGLLGFLAATDVPAPHHDAAPGTAVEVAATTAEANRRETIAEIDATARGTALSNRFTLTSRVSLGEQPVTFRLAGQMEILVIDRRRPELLVQARLPGTRVTLEGSDDASFGNAIAKALEQPFALRLDLQGRILGYRFAPGVIADHRNWVRTVMAAFRFAGAGEASYETSEGDNTGMARVSYQRTGERLLRTRLCYPALPQAHPGGRSVAVLTAIWPRHAEVDEQLRLDLPEAATAVASHLQGQLELLAISRTSDLPAADWISPWASASGEGEQSELAASAIAQQWHKRLQGVQVSDLLARLTAILAQSPLSEADLQEQLELLAKLIELRPEVLTELALLARDSARDPRLLEIVFCAAGRAGTVPAQSLLLGCAEDAALPAALRQNAVEALFPVAAPSAVTVARIGALLDTAAITPVQGAALLLLGAYADRSAEAPALMLATEARMQEQGLTPLFLEALGNAGTQDSFTAARRYCDDADDHVRAAAMTALRKQGSAAAVAILTGRLAGDSSPRVRRYAASALAENPARMDLDVLARLAGHDADEQVRGTALVALHRRGSGSAAVQSLLQRSASEDPSEDVRRMAQQLLQR